MKGWIIVAKMNYQAQAEMIAEAPSERSGIARADRVYCLDLADTVVVVECDTKTNLYNTVYKRERKCKHPNVQFTLTTSGIEPVCCGCGIVMMTNRVEITA